MYSCDKWEGCKHEPFISWHMFVVISQINSQEWAPNLTFAILGTASRWSNAHKKVVPPINRQSSWRMLNHSGKDALVAIDQWWMINHRDNLHINDHDYDKQHEGMNPSCLISMVLIVLEIFSWYTVGSLVPSASTAWVLLLLLLLLIISMPLWPHHRMSQSSDHFKLSSLRQFCLQKEFQPNTSKM